MHSILQYSVKFDKKIKYMHMTCPVNILKEKHCEKFDASNCTNFHQLCQYE